MKSVLISIQPKWCELIASSEKTLEVRKTRPKLETPFKCYIYATKVKPGWFDLAKKERFDGKVIGEFVCDNIRCFDVPYPAFQKELDKRIMDESCCTYYQLHRYAYHDAMYGWHISNLVIYETPKKLSDFKKYNRTCYYDHLGLATPKCKDCKGCQVDRPPQSWCYVETLE